MTKKFTLPQTPKDAQDFFFQYYQHDTLFKKANVLRALLKEDGKILSDLNTLPMSTTNIDSLKGMIVAETNYTMYQAIEAMFALAFACLYQPDRVWQYMTDYNSSDLYKKIVQVAKEGIGTLTGKTDEEVIKELVYLKARTELMAKDLLRKNCTAIARFMKQMAKIFLNKDDYNAYKHGLRNIRVDTQALYTDEKTREIRFDEKQHNSFYLTKSQDGKRTLKMKPFFPDVSLESVRLCWHITKAITVNRMPSPPLDKEGRYKFFDFTQADLDFIDKQARISTEVTFDDS